MARSRFAFYGIGGIIALLLASQIPAFASDIILVAPSAPDLFTTLDYMKPFIVCALALCAAEVFFFGPKHSIVVEFASKTLSRVRNFVSRILRSTPLPGRYVGNSKV